LDIRVFDGSGAAAHAYVETFDGDGDGSRVVGLNPSDTTADFSDDGIDPVKFIYDRCSP
jgi:hypothetical protein